MLQSEVEEIKDYMSEMENENVILMNKNNTLVERNKLDTREKENLNSLLEDVRFVSTKMETDNKTLKTNFDALLGMYNLSVNKSD